MSVSTQTHRKLRVLKISNFTNKTSLSLSSLTLWLIILLYHFIRSRYENTELVFIAHDVNAYECSEEQFFQRGSSGGTIVSSALEMMESIMLKRYHPDNWNVYAFQCSDGDNWPTDNEHVTKLIQNIKPYCQLFGYCEIEPADEQLKWSDETTLWGCVKVLADSNLKMAKVSVKTDVWEAFNHFFGGKLANV